MNHVLTAATFLSVAGAALFVYFLVRINVAARRRRTSFMESDFFKEPEDYPMRRQIPDGLIFTPNVSSLTVKDYNDADTDPAQRRPVSLRQNEALKRASAKMMRFDKPMTNEEIKTEFGYANLEIIAGYESNFERYTHAMLRWAEALHNEGEAASAVAVLELCVNDGAEISKIYTMLASLYSETLSSAERGEKLNLLYAAANANIRSGVLDKTLECIDDIRRKGK